MLLLLPLHSLRSLHYPGPDGVRQQQEGQQLEPPLQVCIPLLVRPLLYPEPAVLPPHLQMCVPQQVRPLGLTQRWGSLCLERPLLPSPPGMLLLPPLLLYLVPLCFQAQHWQQAALPLHLRWTLLQLASAPQAAAAVAVAVFAAEPLVPLSDPAGQQDNSADAPVAAAAAAAAAAAVALSSTLLPPPLSG